MTTDKPEFQIIMQRPIDCTSKQLRAFANIVMIGEEIPIDNLKRGIPAAEMLFFSILDRKIVGVSCVRYANAKFHKHLFEKAGALQMYNPSSIEFCWLSVLPEYRGQGVWVGIQKARADYMEDRPGHAIYRVDNKHVIQAIEKYNFSQAGTAFYPDTGNDKVRLITQNHDPVYEPTKKLRYC